MNISWFIFPVSILAHPECQLDGSNHVLVLIINPGEWPCHPIVHGSRVKSCSKFGQPPVSFDCKGIIIRISILPHPKYRLDGSNRGLAVWLIPVRDFTFLWYTATGLNYVPNLANLQWYDVAFCQWNQASAIHYDLFRPKTSTIQVLSSLGTPKYNYGVAQSSHSTPRPIKVPLRGSCKAFLRDPHRLSIFHRAIGIF
jgi:hypothetical protein